MENNAASPNAVNMHSSDNTNVARDAHLLPKGIYTSFLAEGAANIIYRIGIKEASKEEELIERALSNVPVKAIQGEYQLPAQFWDSKLLRLRKNIESIAPTAVTYAHFVNNIRPLFNDTDLLHYELVDLRESGIVDQLNADLIAWETKTNHAGDHSLPSECRRQKRKGIYLAHEPYGLLVNDMSPRTGINLLEFKPKWLQQSPAAPKGSKRCRTCAKRARENALDGKHSVMGAFCPLDLVSMDYEVLLRPAKALLKIENPQLPEEIKKLHDFCDWVRGSVIHRLAASQAALDPKGVFDADPGDNKFLTAMSLRDCSLFLRIHDPVSPEETNSRYEARLGDLDVKLAIKAPYWRSVELPLIEEGWYMGTEAEELRQPLDCSLYPEYWTPASERHLLAIPQ